MYIKVVFLRKQLENLGSCGRFQQGFSQLNIANGRGDEGKNLEILRLPVIRTANHKNQANGRLIERIPIEPLFLLDANGNKEGGKLFHFGVGNGHTHANSSGDNFLALKNGVAKGFPIGELPLFFEKIDERQDCLIACGGVEKGYEGAIEIIVGTYDDLSF